MAQYRKKPVAINAVQWTGNNLQEAAHFCSAADYTVSGQHLIIKTLEGDMTASPGDWIIRGVKGEFYPCKPDIFAATYDEA
jgi:hypothetical protein